MRTTKCRRSDHFLKSRWKHLLDGIGARSCVRFSVSRSWVLRFSGPSVTRRRRPERTRWLAMVATATTSTTTNMQAITARAAPSRAKASIARRTSSKPLKRRASILRRRTRRPNRQSRRRHPNKVVGARGVSSRPVRLPVFPFRLSQWPLTRLVEKQRLSSDVTHARTIGVGIVKLAHVDTLFAANAGVHRHRGIDALLHRDHQAALAGGDQFDS